MKITSPQRILKPFPVDLPIVTYDTGGSPEAAGKITGAVVDVGSIVGLNATTINSILFQQTVCWYRGKQFVTGKMTERYYPLF